MYGGGGEGMILSSGRMLCICRNVCPVRISYDFGVRWTRSDRRGNFWGIEIMILYENLGCE